MPSEEFLEFCKSFENSLPTIKSLLKPDFTNPNIFHDGIIVAEDTELYVVIEEVSQWSFFLEGAFKEEKKNCKTIFDKPVIHLPDVAAVDMNNVLQLMYSAEQSDFNFSESQLKLLIALSYSLWAPNILKKCKECVQQDVGKLDKIKLLDMACQYNLVDIQKYIIDTINQHLRGYDLIQLLQVAFKHNLEEIKKNIRAELFAIKLKPGSQCCHEACRVCDGGKKETCSRNENGKLYNPYIFCNIEKIAKLPRAIKNYILHSIQ